MHIRRLLVLGVVCLLASNAFAWNQTGHRVIARIAYDRLQPVTKARVDALLKQHPDYPSWVQGIPVAQRGATAFAKAAEWPDAIRDDPRFYSVSANVRPTPAIPGLPSLANQRHEEWHYTNVPFTTDNTPTLPPASVNILTKLQDFQSLGTMPPLMQVYVLPWLIHLIGDVHQPLHTTALFRKDLPKGDRGGNSIQLKSGNLHSYWDSRIGTSTSDAFITQTATLITARTPLPTQLSMDPAVWVQESVSLRTKVYSFQGKGTKQDPAILSDQYATDAKAISFQRAALAGYRLAALLNQQLK